MERKKAKGFQELLVWQRAHALVLTLYRESSRFPQAENYGLTTQLRRAAVSVPANIAEAFKRRSRIDKARLMNIAQGSLEEVRYFLILANDLGYLDSSNHIQEIEEVSRLLGAYIRTLLTPDS